MKHTEILDRDLYPILTSVHGIEGTRTNRQEIYLSGGRNLVLLVRCYCVINAYDWPTPTGAFSKLSHQRLLRQLTQSNRLNLTTSFYKVNSLLSKHGTSCYFTITDTKVTLGQSA